MGDSDTSLLLSLKHPQPSIRVSAVEQLMSIITDEQVWCEASLPVSHRDNYFYKSQQKVLKKGKLIHFNILQSAHSNDVWLAESNADVFSVIFRSSVFVSK